MKRAVVWLSISIFFVLTGNAQFTNVNVGASANDGTGDPARTAFQKLNFTDNLIWARLLALSNSVPAAITTIYVTDPQFGAVGDYTGSKTLAGTGTDNRVAIQAALNSAHINGPGGRSDYLGDKRKRVVVPEGKYYISAPTSGMPSLVIPLGVELDFHEAELHFDIPPCNYTSNGITEPNPAWCAILAGPLANIRVGEMQIAAGKDQTYGGVWYGMTLDGIRVQESDVGWITGEGRDHYIFGFFRGAGIRILASYDIHVENLLFGSSACGVVMGYMGNAFDAYTLYRDGSAAARVSTSLWIDNCVFRNMYRVGILVGADGDWHNPTVPPGPVSGGLEYISGSKAAQGGPVSISHVSMENCAWGAITSYTPAGAFLVDDLRLEECDDATTSVGVIYGNSTTYKVNGVSFGSTGLRTITLANYGSANSVVTCVPNLLFRSDGVDVAPLIQNVYANNNAVNSAIFCALSANGRLPTIINSKGGSLVQWQGVGSGMHGLIPPLGGGTIWNVSTVGLAPLETVNGSITNFSFVNGFTPQIPQRLLIDGQMLFGTNANASVNWVWDTTNLHTMTIPTKDVRAFF